MAASFLHGIEVIEVDNGPVPITVVLSAVIGLIGAAPQWAVSGAIPVWNPSTVYAVGNYALDGNGNIEQASAVTSTDTSGTTAPTWPTQLNNPVAIATITEASTTATATTASAHGFATGQKVVIAGSSVSGYNGTFTITVTSSTTFTFTATGSLGSATGGTATLSAATTDNNVTWNLVALAGTPAFAAIAGAPDVNIPTLVSSENEAAGFGPIVMGYNIPYALNKIQEQGAGQVVVVNVFDQTKHYSSIASTAFTFSAGNSGVINLGHMGVSNVVVTNTGGSTTYNCGIDFEVDFVNGIITNLAGSGGSIAAAASVKVAFNYADPTKVTDAQVIGGVTNGVYTGISALQTTYQTMGFFSKILLAHDSKNQPVAAALDAMAQTIRAIALVDSPSGTSVATAIANRGVAGNAFDTSSKRTVLCFPQEQFYDTGIIPTGVSLSSQNTPIQNQLNAVSVGPYSPYVAGAIAARDLANGYWWSPSNWQLDGPLGPDVQIYASAIDAASDTNDLNAAGILTIFNAFGTGLRVWGNRSAAYPSSTEPDNFISVRRTMDILEQSVELAMLQFIDQPISNALITAILQSVNAFIQTLIMRGALVAGSASYDPSQNPTSQIAAGQLVFDIDVMPPPPAERLTFQTTIDTSLLSQLGQTTAQSAPASQTA